MHRNKSFILRNNAMRSIVPSVDRLTDLYILDSLKGFGPQKFKLCHQAGLSVSELIENPARIPIPGKRGDPIRKQLTDERAELQTVCRARAEKQLNAALKFGFHIITYSDTEYPQSVFESNNPVPILYCAGNLELLRSTRIVACVGSRNIRPPYVELLATFARCAAANRFTVVSGFALGADTVGHSAAVDAGGNTICVMPAGLDRPFPPENKPLRERFLAGSSALFVSEFPFGIGANSLNLRKRNKLIVSFAKGVLVGQSADDGGAMNAYRFAMEQKKPVATFRSDGKLDTTGNQLIAASNDPAWRVFEQAGGQDEQFSQWLRQLSF